MLQFTVKVHVVEIIGIVRKTLIVLPFLVHDIFHHKFRRENYIILFMLYLPAMPTNIQRPVPVGTGRLFLTSPFLYDIKLFYSTKVFLTHLHTSIVSSMTCQWYIICE